jgi:DNA-binding response OmpR family regulator
MIQPGVKILIVEDDERVARFLVRALTEEGYVVDLCTTGADAIAHVSAGIYDAIVLDWMLPDVDGLAVCRAVRRSGSVAPVLMVTARGEIAERVLGLDAGADDYLVKPFHVSELTARMRALLRRTTGFARLRAGELEIDRVGRRVAVAGVAAELTAREYALLLQLMQHAEQVVTRTELLARVWESSFDPGSNLVEVHISHLRDKLGAAAWMIETVRGAGYRLRTRRPA